jgi:molybdopterin/thiamine biosynthesis adenylyltransferase
LRVLEPAAAESSWQPIVFDTTAVGREAIDRLRHDGAIWQSHDTIEGQLLDLMETRRPWLRRLPPQERRPHLVAALGEHLGGTPIADWGRWVFYPWSGRLVHLLPPDEFRELRLDRNRNKLADREIAHLRTCTVGVVGLSVGNAVVLTLALEGVAGHLKLADFDHLDLSNMNRIRAGTHEIGVRKTVIAARQIFEFDPYASVSLFHDGLTEENIEAFLGGNRPVDVVVDECDGIQVKFMLRYRARSRRLPLVMETSDRGMLDVERFDLEPERPIFHGLVPDVDPASLQHLTSDDKARYVLAIIGAETMSARMGASLIEVERTIATWPQLASDVVLGGASVTHAVRRILLGLPLASGRRFIDLDASMERIAAAPSAPPLPAPARGLIDRSALTPLVAELLDEAMTAPSGGNVQPWSFVVEGDTVLVGLDPSQNSGLLDVDHTASIASIGAVCEIIAIGAAARGWRADLTTLPAEEPGAFARVELVKGAPDPALALLHPLVRARHTNRKAEQSAPLIRSEIDAITATAEALGARLDWLLEPSALHDLGEVIGRGDRVRMLNPALNDDMRRELSFAPVGDVPRAISVDTCELTDLERASIRLILRKDVAERARALGGADRLGDLSRKALATAAAAAVLHIADDAPITLLGGGRAMLRSWLVAAGLGLCWQPVGSLPYMARLAARSSSPMAADERAEILGLDAELDRFFPNAKGRTKLMLFRLHRSRPASARSGRMPFEALTQVRQPAERRS